MATAWKSIFFTSMRRSSEFLSKLWVVCGCFWAQTFSCELCNVCCFCTGLFQITKESDELIFPVVYGVVVFVVMKRFKSITFYSSRVSTGYWRYPSGLNVLLTLISVPYTPFSSYWFILEHPKGVTEREPLLETARTEGDGKGHIIWTMSRNVPILYFRTYMYRISLRRLNLKMCFVLWMSLLINVYRPKT